MKPSLKSDSPSSPLVVVAIGDLNCHLGHFDGLRCPDTQNAGGVKWKELIDSNSLYVPSLASIAKDPAYTYQYSNASTTLDYVLSNLTTSQILTSCHTLDDDPLNTSDLLPIVTRLTPNHPILSSPSLRDTVPHNRNRAQEDGHTDVYATQTDYLIRPLLEDCLSIQEIEDDLYVASKSLLSISFSTISRVKRSKNSR